MSSPKDIQVIEKSRLELNAEDKCNGCGGTDDLTRFDLRIGWNALCGIIWCSACRAKVVSFLSPERGELKAAGRGNDGTITS